MRNFQDIFETIKRSFISAFSVCMTVPLMSIFSVDFDNFQKIYVYSIFDNCKFVSQHNN